MCEVGLGLGEIFEVRKGLRQGCAISPWLFNIYFDKVVKQVNERANGEGSEIDK